MSICQSLQNLDEDRFRARFGDGAGRFDQRSQSPALRVFHDDIAFAELLKEGIDPDDVGVHQLCLKLSLVSESGAEPGVLRKRGHQDFDGDLTIQGRILTEIDLAHATLSHEFEYFVMLDHGSDAMHILLLDGILYVSDNRKCDNDNDQGSSCPDLKLVIRFSAQQRAKGQIQKNNG